MRNYFLVAGRLFGGELVGGDFVGGEIVWWRDDGFIEGGGRAGALQSFSLLRIKTEWGFRIYRIFQDRVPGL